MNDIDIIASWLFFAFCFGGLLLTTFRLVRDLCKKQDERINNIYNSVEEIIDHNSWRDYDEEKPTKGNTYLFAKYDKIGKTIVYQVRKYDSHHDRSYKILAWKPIEEYIPKEEEIDVF